jgi:hypothetical protein
MDELEFMYHKVKKRNINFEELNARVEEYENKTKTMEEKLKQEIESL